MHGEEARQDRGGGARQSIRETRHGRERRQGKVVGEEAIHGRARQAGAGKACQAGQGRHCKAMWLRWGN